ncbi:MAG: sugar phosphate nucleotidyltransferase [Candidatus Fermentibacteraceae bacterium]
MHCIIPAAGMGTRMRPHTWSVPKPLLPVAGKPILAHLIDSLTSVGVDRLTLVTGYLGSMLVDWTRNAYPGHTVDFVEQKHVSGLGAAVGLARDLVDDGPVMVALADTLFEADLGILRNCPVNMLAVCPVTEPERFGIVVTDPNGRVLRLVEKPKEPVGNLAIVGVYYFAQGSSLMRACDELSRLGITTRGEYQLTDAMQLMLQGGQPFETIPVEKWYDCGTTETLLFTNRALLDSRGGTGTPSLENSVVVQPCAFGQGVVLRDSVVGPHVSVGDGAVIERCVIRDSVLGAGVRVNGGSMTGSMLGAGTVVRQTPKSLSIGDDCSLEI